MTEQSSQELPEDIQKRIDEMKNNCIFCKISKKEIPSKIIYEDDFIIVILDINPATNGHLIISPKEHYMVFPMVPDDIITKIFIVVKSLSDLLIKTFNAEDVSTFIANGKIAGQNSQHFFIHLIPRYENDGVNLELHRGDNLSLLELEALKQKFLEKFKDLQK